MPNYDLVYLHTDGSVAAIITSLCDDDTKAKILAHAMRVNGASQMEVWKEETLIYTRPWRIEPEGTTVYSPGRYA